MRPIINLIPLILSLTCFLVPLKIGYPNSKKIVDNEIHFHPSCHIKDEILEQKPFLEGLKCKVFIQGFIMIGSYESLGIVHHPSHDESSEEKKEFYCNNKDWAHNGSP